MSIPNFQNSDLLLFNLDLFGIACSGGSACSSGNLTQSHVVSEIENLGGPVIRFSFGKFNKLDEVDFTIDQLVSLFD